MKKILASVLFTFAPPVVALWADTLVLRDGSTHTGTFVSGNERTITMDMGRGRSLRDFSIAEVQSLRFDDYAAEQRQRGANRRTTDSIPGNNDRYRADTDSRADQRTAAQPDQGAIQNKYAQMGGRQGRLGAASATEQATPDGRGRFQHYQDASIYWKPQVGAHEVRGPIRSKWASMAWEQGMLGYPTSDDVAIPNGGAYTKFEHGAIYYTPRTGAHVLVGSIGDHWISLGAERSELGYPVSDEQVDRDGQSHYQEFERGRIYWNPRSGVRVERR